MENDDYKEPYDVEDFIPREPSGRTVIPAGIAFDPDKFKDNEVLLTNGDRIAKIPKLENRIFIRRSKNRPNAYVEFIVDRYYDKEKKQSRVQKLIIGTDISDKYRGMMLINGNYHKYFDYGGNLNHDLIQLRRQTEAEGRQAAQEKWFHEQLYEAETPEETGETTSEEAPEETQETPDEEAPEAEINEEELPEETADEAESPKAEPSEGTKPAPKTPKEETKKDQSAIDRTISDIMNRTSRDRADAENAPAQTPTNKIPSRKGDDRTVDEIRESLLRDEKQLTQKLQEAEEERKKYEEARKELDHIRSVKILQLQEAEEEHFRTLSYMLDSYIHTINEQSKRRPDTPMTPKLIQAINELLIELRGYFAGCATEGYLRLGEEAKHDETGDTPATTYMEMSIILTAYHYTAVAYKLGKLKAK